jgi:hypothetical protein
MFNDYKVESLSMSQPKAKKNKAPKMYFKNEQDEHMNMQYCSAEKPFIVPYKLGNWNDEEGAVAGRISMCTTVTDESLEAKMTEFESKVIVPHLCKHQSFVFGEDAEPVDEDSLEISTKAHLKGLMKKSSKYPPSIKFKVDTLGNNRCMFFDLVDGRTKPIKYYDIEPRDRVIVIGGFRTVYNLMGSVGITQHAQRVLRLPTVSSVPMGFNLGDGMAVPLPHGDEGGNEELKSSAGKRKRDSEDDEEEDDDDENDGATTRIDPVTMEVIQVQSKNTNKKKKTSGSDSEEEQEEQEASADEKDDN